LILIFVLVYSISHFILFKKISLKSLIYCLVGLISGVVINPYFPKNLVYYRQIFKMALVPYYKIIGIGAEWYPYNFSYLISNTSFIFILISIALVLFFIFLKKQSKESLTLLFLSLFFFFYTLKARRQVEYFVPFTILFSAFSLNDSLKNIVLKDYWCKFLEIFQKRKILISILLVYFFLAIPFVAVRDLGLAKKELAKRFKFDSFQRVSLWLKKNTPEKSIVFQSDWGSFPILFYYNAHNYYLTGLDQTFMYEYNKELYWLWYDITTGKKRDNLYQIIKSQFRANYVLVEKDKLNLNNLLRTDSNFQKIYEDKEVWLYKLRD